MEEPMAVDGLIEQDSNTRMLAVLEHAYATAEQVVEGYRADDLERRLGAKLLEKVTQLGRVKNAARGVAVTLTAYKLVAPEQDVRAHKADHKGGFSARAFDTRVTVPFLIERSLPRSVESHWLSQTFSFAGPVASVKVV